MSAVDEILGSIPLDSLAAQVGADPQQVEQAAAAVLPALLGGLEANASDPSGASSLLDALGQHQDDLLGGGFDPSRADTADGEAIMSHIFGGSTDGVVNALGGLGGSGGAIGGQLVRKLLPILAPLVLSWLAKRVMAGRSGGGMTLPTPGGQEPAPSIPPSSDAPVGGRSAGGPGSLEDLLRDVLGGATGGAANPNIPTQPAPQQQRTAPGGLDAGSIITDVLGGMLGGGRR